MPTVDPIADAQAARPALRQGRHIAAEASITVARPLDRFDRWFQHVALEDILLGHGSIPAITHTAMIAGTWSEPGARRRVFMADGSSVLEEVIAQDRPHYFAYMVWGFGGLIGRLAAYGRGEFFTQARGDGATEIRWVYSFAPRSALAALPLALIVRAAFRPFMRASIDTIRRVAEERIELPGTALAAA